MTPFASGEDSSAAAGSRGYVFTPWHDLRITFSAAWHYDAEVVECRMPYTWRLCFTGFTRHADVLDDCHFII